MEDKIKLLKGLKKNNSGQALLLIIVVLFIVFFLVVSLSENISVDTVNTIQNQNFQKAFAAATSGLSAAKNYITTNGCCGNNSSLSSGILSYGTGYQYNYVIQAQQEINQNVQSDYTLQALVDSSTTADIAFNRSSSILFANVIFKTPQTINGVQTMNAECVFYPQGMSLNGVQANLGSFSQGPSSICGAIGPALPLQTSGTYNGYYETTLNLNNNAQFIRAYVVNYNTGLLTNIIIHPSQTSIQQYQIIATGYYNNSRRDIDAYFSLQGDPPGIFDYVLFNGETNSVGNPPPLAF